MTKLAQAARADDASNDEGAHPPSNPLADPPGRSGEGSSPCAGPPSQARTCGTPPRPDVHDPAISPDGRLHARGVTYILSRNTKAISKGAISLDRRSVQPNN